MRTIKIDNHRIGPGQPVGTRFERGMRRLPTVVNESDRLAITFRIPTQRSAI